MRPHYYRQAFSSFFPPLTRMVKALIIVTTAVFILTYIPARMFGWYDPYVWFSLSPQAVVHRGWIWQIFTYLFMHGGFFHILFNMFALWMFGADLEMLWGGPKFLYFYFLCGVGAGIFDVVLTSLFGPGYPTATIGASGAIYGLLMAYGLLFPERPIFIWFIIPIKAKWFVLIIGLIEFFSEFGGPGAGISHIAHLSGMLIALLYLRGGGFSGELSSRYGSWRRNRLRRQFDVYMHRQDKKDDPKRWIN